MRRPMFDLWLRSATVLTVAVGLVAAAASSVRLEGPWRLLYDVLDWPIDGDPAAFSRETAAMHAVLGGVMVAWGTLMHLIAVGPFRRGDTALAGPMLIAVVAWFAVDSTGSLVAGLPGNVLLNVGFLALFVPPLVHLLRPGRRPAPSDP